MTQADLLREIENLKAQNEVLKAKMDGKRNGNLSLKVSQKGAVSVYGLGRFPVTLYQEQWVRLLNKDQDIRTFIKANEANLASKERAA